MDIKFRFKPIAAGVAFVAYASTPAIAEDIEIYTTANLSAGAIQPNVMFVIDTSGSMGGTLSVPNSYDYTQTYSGCYDNTKIYYTSSGALPDCSSKAMFDKASNTCDASVQLYDKGVVIDTIGPLEKQGFFADQVAQFNSKKKIWQAISSKNPKQLTAAGGVGDGGAKELVGRTSGDEAECEASRSSA